MGINTVTLRFSTEDNARSLESCLEQLLLNLHVETREES